MRKSKVFAVCFALAFCISVFCMPFTVSANADETQTPVVTLPDKSSFDDLWVGDYIAFSAEYDDMEFSEILSAEVTQGAEVAEIDVSSDGIDGFKIIGAGTAEIKVSYKNKGDTAPKEEILTVRATQRPEEAKMEVGCIDTLHVGNSLYENISITNLNYGAEPRFEYSEGEDCFPEATYDGDFRCFDSSRTGYARCNPEAAIKTGTCKGIAYADDKQIGDVQTINIIDDEPTIDYKIPNTIKIGQGLNEDPNDVDVSVPTIATGTHLPLGILSLDSTPALHDGCFGMHQGGIETVNPDGTGTWFKNVSYAYVPGQYTIQAMVNEQKIGNPFSLTIEEPVIETNAPATIKQGDSLTLTTALTNTALENRSVADYDNPANWNEDHTMFDPKGDDIYEGHIPAYRPTITILEGKDLIKQEQQDYSNTLKSSETLTFTGAGTVKLKVKYDQFATCGDCMAIKDENYKPTGKFETYSPEKIITINVAGNEKPPVTEDDPKIDKSELEAIINQKPENASAYTDDSYKAYTDALKKAKAVLNDPNATPEQITQATKDLEKAKAGLKPVSSKTESATISESTSDNPETESTTTNQSTSDNPKTGDTTPIIPLLTLVGASTCAMYLLRKKCKK